MVPLELFEKYCWYLVNTVEGLDELLPVTIDDQMGKKIMSLPSGQVTLFMFPPIAESKGASVDAYSEVNRCVLFVMAKYDPLRETSYNLLKKLQPVIESVKENLIASRHEFLCEPYQIDVSSIETAPETELYGRFAGWSVGFEVTSY